MYEIQHQTKQLWESEPYWGLIARHDTLARCVEGIKRILTPMNGEKPRNPDDYRIVSFAKNGRVLGIFDRHGDKIGGAPEYGNGPVRLVVATPKKVIAKKRVLVKK